jgi:hypothetical protein
MDRITEWTKVWSQLLDVCTQEGIVTVIPAGNSGFGDFKDLSSFLPQALASTTGSTIVVGGVFSDGHLHVNTTLDFEHGPPAIGVYAQSFRVLGASDSSDTGITQYGGTSFASPAVVSVFISRALCCSQVSGRPSCILSFSAFACVTVAGQS